MLSWQELLNKDKIQAAAAGPPGPWGAVYVRVQLSQVDAAGLMCTMQRYSEQTESHHSAVRIPKYKAHEEARSNASCPLS